MCTIATKSLYALFVQISDSYFQRGLFRLVRENTPTKTKRVFGKSKICSFSNEFAQSLKRAKHARSYLSVTEKIGSFCFFFSTPSSVTSTHSLLELERIFLEVFYSHNKGLLPYFWGVYKKFRSKNWIYP